jgi:hypothetical protein
MKKTLSVLISALLAFAGLTVVSAPAHATDITVTIHYHRFDANYEAWNLYFWNLNSPDITTDHGHYFEVDETAAKFGATFTMSAVEAEEGFGFVVKDGAEWGGSKDQSTDGGGSPGDHLASWGGGSVDIWIVQGSDIVFYEEPSFPQAVDTPAASVKVGKLIKLDGRTDKAAVVTWTSKTKKVCSVVMKSGKPKLKGLKKGLCRIKAVAVGVGEYGAYSKNIAVYVN